MYYLFAVTLYDKMVVLEAVVLTLSVTIALTVYTLQSKRDFSSWGAGYVSNYFLFKLFNAGESNLGFNIPPTQVIHGSRTLV